MTFVLLFSVETKQYTFYSIWVYYSLFSHVQFSLNVTLIYFNTIDIANQTLNKRMVDMLKWDYI